MLKPFWLLTVTATGLAVWHELPTGTGRPATVSFVTWMLMEAFVVTAPVLRLTDPVALPTWLKAVVAVTGMSPNCLNEAVAGGSVKVADSLPVLRFTDDFSVPGPSATFALTLLITVFPVTGYLTVRVEDP